MSIDVVLQFNLKMVMKMKQILLIALTLLFFIPIPFVQAVETGILFRREVHGKLGRYKEGNAEKNEKYLGEINNGKPNGKGTLSSPYGGTYVGEFRDGLPHGLGILKLPDGKIYDGQWIDGI